METPHKFPALDGLRGVAALVVAEFHFHELFGNVYPVHGYLAVDLFFMLSGFVLTFAYQKKLDGGYPTASFMKTRLARLYPLYFLGLILGCLSMSAMDKNVQASRPGELFFLFTLSLLMLPAPPVHGSWTASAFPFNLPMWSLFFEVLANFYHAFFLRRKSWKFLLAVAFISGLVLLYAMNRLGLFSIGYRRRDSLAGIPRVLLSYTIGVIVFRIWKTGRFRWNIPTPLLGVLFPGSLLVPRLVTLVSHRRVGNGFDFLMVTCFFPMLLLAGACSVPSPRIARLCSGAGTASYALYALHVPFGGLLEMGWSHFRGHAMAQDSPWSGFIFLVLLIPVALLADHFYDQGARKFLRRKLIPAES